MIFEQIKEAFAYAWETGLFSVSIKESISLKKSLILIGAAILISLLISLVYIFTHRKVGYSTTIIMNILLMGPIVSIIVICIGSNIARAISIGGGLALIRYRTTIEDPKAIIYLLLSMASGMACGTGFVGFDIVAVVMILLVAVIANLVGFDRLGGRMMKLSIVVPESLNFHGAFDDDLKTYCKFFNLDKIRTTDYGTLVELEYRIRMKDISQQKELIDSIRTKNGNLKVTLVQKAVEK